MPEILCEACNTPHTPNAHAPYCCSRCAAYGRRRAAKPVVPTATAEQRERAALRRDVETLQATVAAQSTLIASLQRRASQLQGQVNRLWALYRRLRLRWLRRRF